MAVGSHEGVWVSHGLARLIRAGPDALRDIFQIDLVADARARGHHLEIVERMRAPLEECIALAVALIFQLDVLAEGLGVAKLVDHDAMVSDENHGQQRIELWRAPAK